MCPFTSSSAQTCFSAIHAARRLALGLALLAPMGMPFDGWCADQATAASNPGNLVRTTTAALFTALDENREAIDQDPARVNALVDEKVMPHVDLAKISRWILAKQWRRASPTPPRRVAPTR